MKNNKEPLESWHLEKTTLHAHCKVYDIRKCRFRHPVRNLESDFYVIDSLPWVNVCAVTADRELVMIRQFRFGVRDFVWEFPGGILDAGEAVIDAGLRELREETGYRGIHPRVIGEVWPNPAIQNNACTLIRVDEATLSHELDWDEHEEIEVALIPYEELLDWGRSGKLKHSIAINQLYFLEKSFQE